MITAANNHVDTARVLIEAGTDLSLRDDANHTALALAEERGNHSIVSAIKGEYIWYH